ncbi:MAG: GntR family transcriptional regulator [Treponema sp.]|jgi:DNA-binding GntR family transcriptional regulator|nr:GntR family transcriptional regulator [Treponema sp.]
MESYVPLHNNAYAYLRENILQGKFQPGKFYSETKLAKEIGLSRTPVRVALQQLQREKLIEIIPNKGFSVCKMTVDDIVETYQIRAAIEGYAAAQLARDKSVRSKGEIKKLERLYIKQKEQLRKPFDLAGFTFTDEKFHETLVDYLENTGLSELFFNQFYKIHVIAVNTFHIPERPRQAIKEHDAIIKAICSGCSQAAYDAVLEHLENIEKYMRRLLKEKRL